MTTELMKTKTLEEQIKCLKPDEMGGREYAAGFTACQNQTLDLIHKDSATYKTMAYEIKAVSKTLHGIALGEPHGSNIYFTIDLIAKRLDRLTSELEAV